MLLTAEQIHQRVRELGEQITSDYAGGALVVLGVLNGAFVFLADLLRELDLDCRVDFVAVSSYGDTVQPSEEPEITRRPSLPLAGQRVLLVEDIVDTGRTLAWLLQWLGSQAEQVRACCLLDKPSRREVPVRVDYVGFAIPDHFVVGYGLDFARRYRHLPYVAVLRPEVHTRPPNGG